MEPNDSGSDSDIEKNDDRENTGWLLKGWFPSFWKSPAPANSSKKRGPERDSSLVDSAKRARTRSATSKDLSDVTDTRSSSADQPQAHISALLASSENLGYEEPPPPHMDHSHNLSEPLLKRPINKNSGPLAPSTKPSLATTTLGTTTSNARTDRTSYSRGGPGPHQPTPVSMSTMGPACTECNEDQWREMVFRGSRGGGTTAVGDTWDPFTRGDSMHMHTASPLAMTRANAEVVDMGIGIGASSHARPQPHPQGSPALNSNTGIDRAAAMKNMTSMTHAPPPRIIPQFGANPNVNTTHSHTNMNPHATPSTVKSLQPSARALSGVGLRKGEGKPGENPHLGAPDSRLMNRPGSGSGPGPGSRLAMGGGGQGKDWPQGSRENMMIGGESMNDMNSSWNVGEGDKAASQPWGNLLSLNANHPHVTLSGQYFTIGRHWRCNLQLLDPNISRLFCRLIYMNGSVVVEGLSKNGKLFINNKPVQPNTKQPINPGDEITIMASSRFSY
eukprot:Ihof_evm1s47 gene=Ihof_evmTU1s47